MNFAVLPFLLVELTQAKSLFEHESLVIRVNQNQRNLNFGIPLIDIEFLDDGYKDRVVLERFYSNDAERSKNVQTCNFIGHLEMDTDSAIALTGCPGIEDVELTINTKHSLPSNMFILRKDGQLETVTPTDMEKQLPTMEMMFNYSDVKSATLKNVPQNQKIKVKFSVDASFIKFMGGNSGFVGKLLTQAQAYFARPGLGFDIQLENPYNVNHYETQFWTAENSISIVRRNVGFMSSNQDADVYAFLTVDNFPQDGTFGVSSALGGICSLYKTEKVLITEFRLNLLFTARVFVHEIGHLLGMRHDFEHPPSDNCPQNGFMGSGGQSNSWIWSECSKNDFLVYYNSILSSQGKWCLNE